MAALTDESIEVKVVTVRRAISKIDFAELNKNIQQFHVPETLKNFEGIFGVLKNLWFLT